MNEKLDVINDSIAFIESRLTENLSINELAGQAFFSRTHYQRLFHSIVGEPVMEYIKKRRLQLACVELVETKATVLEIALKYGYGSHEGFLRAFKAHFGVAPTRYRKMKKYHLGEEKEMLSKEVTDRISENMAKAADVLAQFIKDAEALIEPANRTAEAEGIKGATTLVLSCELYYLAKRMGNIKDSVNSFAVREHSVFEVFERIYEIIKNLDDITFQMNLLRFFSGIETSRIIEPKDAFISIDNGYDKLCASLVGNKNSIINLIDDLIMLIREDIKREAANCIKNAVGVLKQASDEGIDIAESVKEASERLNKNGRAFIKIEAELKKRAKEVSYVAELLDSYVCNMEKNASTELQRLSRNQIYTAIHSIDDAAFYMNVNAFNAKIEAVRSGKDENLSGSADKIVQYAGRLNQTHDSCAELFREYDRLSDLLQKDENTNALIQKTTKDLIFMGEILLTQLELESERANNDTFRTLAKSAREALAALSGLKGDTANYKAGLSQYYEATARLAKDCHSEAVKWKKGTAFEYIALEYDKLVEVVRCAAL